MLLELLQQTEEPRSYHRREYKLHHVLYFTIAAISQNTKTYAEVLRLISEHFEMLKRIFNAAQKESKGF
jgi:hypothetical protein